MTKLRPFSSITASDFERLTVGPVETNHREDGSWRWTARADVGALSIWAHADTEAEARALLAEQIEQLTQGKCLLLERRSEVTHAG